MKQSLNVVIEIEKDGKMFSFSMPYGCAIGAAYDAAHACLQEIVKMGQSAAEKSARPMDSSNIEGD